MTEKKPSSDKMKVKNTETVHHEMRSKKKKKGNKVAELNLTSMLDVCFQLLIFFVLTVNFTLDEGILRADLPKGSGQPSKKKDPPKSKTFIDLNTEGVDGVAISIKDHDQVFGDDFELLYTTLRDAGPAGGGGGYLEADSPMIISSFKAVQWRYTVAAFNACVRAKFEDVRFAQPRVVQ